MDESNPTCNKRFAKLGIPQTEAYRRAYREEIAFLSGGQSAQLASARLNSMNLRGNGRSPWALTFSFARAIQQPALELWRGKESNVLAAQQTLLHRARCNSAARSVQYTAAMEEKSA